MEKFFNVTLVLIVVFAFTQMKAPMSKAEIERNVRASCKNFCK